MKKEFKCKKHGKNPPMGRFFLGSKSWYVENVCLCCMEEFFKTMQCKETEDEKEESNLNN